MMDTIEKELETLLKDLDLLDEYGCVTTLDRGQLRHICRYFYNLGKVDLKDNEKYEIVETK